MAIKKATLIGNTLSSLIMYFYLLNQNLTVGSIDDPSLEIFTSGMADVWIVSSNVIYSKSKLLMKC